MPEPRITVYYAGPHGPVVTTYANADKVFITDSELLQIYEGSQLAGGHLHWSYYRIDSEPRGTALKEKRSDDIGCVGCTCCRSEPA